MRHRVPALAAMVVLSLAGSVSAQGFSDFYTAPAGMEPAPAPEPDPIPVRVAPVPAGAAYPAPTPTGMAGAMPLLGEGIPALGAIGDEVKSASPIASSRVTGPAPAGMAPPPPVTSPGAVCIAAIRAAEARHGIPRNLLLAIGLQEAGTKRDGVLTVWPWVVNSHGTGHIFETRAEAEAFVDAERAAGRSLLDVGCMQVNLRWHPEAFAGISDGFDPDRNADYAARFLADLHARGGDWMEAAGNYHSYTPEHHARYVEGLRRNLEVAEARAGEFDAMAAAENAKIAVAAAPGMGKYSRERIARLQPGGFRRQLERVAAKGGLQELPAARPETPEEPMPPGPWWSASLGADGTAAGRSIYSREDIEPVLPVLEARDTAPAGGETAENP